MRALYLAVDRRTQKCERFLTLPELLQTVNTKTSRRMKRTATVGAISARMLDQKEKLSYYLGLILCIG